MHDHRTDLWPRDQRPRDELYRTLLRDDPIRMFRFEPEPEPDTISQIILSWADDGIKLLILAGLFPLAMVALAGLSDWLFGRF